MMKRTLLIFFASLISFIFITCKKESSDYRLEGKIINGNTGAGMNGVFVEIQKQVVSGGTFGAVYSTAATTSTDPSGKFSVSWQRENFAALKMIASTGQYITRESALNVNDFTSGGAVTRNLEIYPEAFIEVQIQNTGSAAATDVFKFTFTNAEFDCLCCAIGWKTFPGIDVDTTWQCRVYGDHWLKYRKEIETADSDTIVDDSIWCPAFQTSTLDISY